MIVVRVRWQKLGGHYHCKVFSANNPDQTFANCGKLVFNEREWDSIKETLFHKVQLLPEDPPLT